MAQQGALFHSVRDGQSGWGFEGLVLGFQNLICHDQDTGFWGVTLAETNCGWNLSCEFDPGGVELLKVVFYIFHTFLYVTNVFGITEVKESKIN